MAAPRAERGPNAVPSSLSFTEVRRPMGARLARAVAIVVGVVVTAVVLWVLVVGALWAYAWLSLGGEDVPVLREDGQATLGSTTGPRAPVDATTVLVALTGPVDPTVPRPPELEAPLLLVQAGGPREQPAVLQVPQDVPLAEELTFAEVQREGGTDPLVRAVVDYTEVRVDHVVSLSIDALPRLVDALGEVEVCRADGCSTPSGDEVRTRLLQAEGDELVLLLADLVRSVSARLDARWAVTAPLEAKRVVDAVSEEVITDVGLRGSRLLEVAEQLAVPVRPELDRLPVLVNPSSGDVLPMHEQVQVRLDQLREGTPLTGEGGTVEDLERDLLAGIEIGVLNGAGVTGLAGRVQAELQAAELTVVGTGNAPTFDRQRTGVSYREEDEAAAFAAIRVSEVLGGVELEPLAERPTFEGEEVDLLVVVGEDLT
ncbi:MAG: LCP family protein [Nitriliruptoraceae bacterium]